MDKVIVFQLPERPISVIYQADYGLPIDRIGQKDVPDGVPFWIVPSEEIPTDRTFRNAWELDHAAMGEPDGVGDTAEFDAWYEEAVAKPAREAAEAAQKALDEMREQLEVQAE